MRELTQIQRDTGYALLCATERSLRALPKDARHLIYAYAFATRAIQSTASPPARMRLLVQITNVPPDQPTDFPIGVAWIMKMDVPRHATVNDIKRRVRSALWNANAARPLGERLSDVRMETIDIRLGIHDEGAHGASSYVAGARCVSRFVGQLHQRGGLPWLFTFV